MPSGIHFEYVTLRNKMSSKKYYTGWYNVLFNIVRIGIFIIFYLALFTSNEVFAKIFRYLMFFSACIFSGALFLIYKYYNDIR